MQPPLTSFFPSAEARERYRDRYAAAMRLVPPVAESLDVPTRYGTARVYRHGTATGTPLLLLHAMTSTAAGWAANVAGLAESRTVFSVDAIGLGGASVQEAPVRAPADHVAWLSEVLDALDVPAAHVVGWSYGGWMAFHCARLAPDRFPTLTLVEPAHVLARFSPGFWARLLALPVLGRLPGSAAKRATERASEWILADLDRRLPSVHRAYAPLFELIAMGNAAVAYLPAGVLIPAYPRARAVRSLRVPAMALLGARSTIHDAAKASRRLTSLVPGAQVHVWPEAGHAVNLEHPDEVNARILAFVDEHDGVRPEAPVASGGVGS